MMADPRLEYARHKSFALRPMPLYPLPLTLYPMLSALCAMPYATMLLARSCPQAADMSCPLLRRMMTV
jgi:hypothetical protein